MYINDSKEVLCLWKCKVRGVVPHVGKAKIKFCYRFDHYKSKNRAFRKDNRQVPQKLFHTHYCLDDHSDIEDWDFVIFEKCETHTQLKERETFWQHRLNTLYPIGLNENYINTKIFSVSLFSAFQLNRILIFWFFHLFLQLDISIFIWSYGHFNLRTVSLSLFERPPTSIHFS